MTNPMINPQPNYSGVTIQITNPTVNAGVSGSSGKPYFNENHISCPQMYCYQPAYLQEEKSTEISDSKVSDSVSGTQNESQKEMKSSGYPSAYPAEYYINNYNYQDTSGLADSIDRSETNSSQKHITRENHYNENNNIADEPNGSQNRSAAEVPLRHYDDGKISQKESDMSLSSAIIGDMNEREEALKAEKKNTKEKKIVALTDEYIKSLENYLNNPNTEIRTMASKEILKRLDEDKDRYDDAALNALLNKMLQDPSKLVRIAALSAFASQLASGNDYTVTLLQNIQSNPSADKEDVLQAADILLKMSAGVEVKNVPIPETNNTEKAQKG